MSALPDCVVQWYSYTSIVCQTGCLLYQTVWYSGTVVHQQSVKQVVCSTRLCDTVVQLYINSLLKRMSVLPDCVVQLYINRLPNRMSALPDCVVQLYINSLSNRMSALPDCVVQWYSYTSTVCQTGCLLYQTVWYSGTVIHQQSVKQDVSSTRLRGTVVQLYINSLSNRMSALPDCMVQWYSYTSIVCQTGCLLYQTAWYSGTVVQK